MKWFNHFTAENLYTWIFCFSIGLIIFIGLDRSIFSNSGLLKPNELVATTLSYTGFNVLLVNVSESMLTCTSTPKTSTSTMASYRLDEKLSLMDSGNYSLWFDPSNLCVESNSTDDSGGDGKMVKKCVMTFNTNGRLGNLMGGYATLFGLAQLNGRPAFMKPNMASVLKKHFKVSLPSLNHESERRLKWTHMSIHDWMMESYTHFEPQYISIVGYTCSWTFYHHLRDRILREFQFQDAIVARVQNKLRQVRGKRQSVTFVGIHVRRGDYQQLMKTKYNGVLADAEFFVKATGIFRDKYSDAVFVVASDDIQWCFENIDNSKNDVHFIGNNRLDPAEDMALLANCNHSIITIGTFGFWTAYLAGGETVYLANYTTPNSSFLDVFKYEAAYLPQWIPIAANLSEWNN